MVHLNIVEGDFVIGYKKADYDTYEKKVEELTNQGYVLSDTDYCLSGDRKEFFTKGNKTVTFNHLAV